jgi:hypothetical protein
LPAILGIFPLRFCWNYSGLGSYKSVWVIFMPEVNLGLMACKEIAVLARYAENRPGCDIP